MASTVSDLYRKRLGTSVTACPPLEPKCSTCGMLECVCRPRFFAGQVLNADDLNRLDAYIRAKHRLHNRQLHGWGVVNGLEVMCNPCGDGVAVGCGYALSPCGDDIVVCDAVSVDVCDLIRRCKDAERKRGPCDPLELPQASACDAAEEDWILAIRYAEQPARGVKPLYAPVEADCGCSCGGKTSCTCGGGKGSYASGAATKKASCGCGAKTAAQCTCTTNARPRGAPVQCEATVVCEGFAFEVYRRPPAPPASDEPRRNVINPDSELIRRFLCCYNDLVANAPQMPGAFTPANILAAPDAWFLWACRLQAHLLRHFQSSPGYNCALLAQLAALIIVRPDQSNLAAFIQAVFVMVLVLLDALFACLCSALLPPCPMPTEETRVPLAVVHVANNPCRVLRVCNWSVERKFATTLPALQYWLAVFPFGVALRRLLQTLCCFDVTTFFRNVDRTVPQNTPTGASTNVGEGTGAVNNGGLTNEQAFLRLNPTLEQATPVQQASTLVMQVLGSRKPLEPEALINSLLGAQSEGPKLTSIESANLPQFLLLNQIAKPMAQAAAGSLGTVSLAGLAQAFMKAPTPGQAAAATAQAAPAQASPAGPAVSEEMPVPAAASEDSVKALRDEIATLHAQIERHASEIEQLKAGGGRSRKGHK